MLFAIVTLHIIVQNARFKNQHARANTAWIAPASKSFFKTLNFWVFPQGLEFVKLEQLNVPKLNSLPRSSPYFISSARKPRASCSQFSNCSRVNNKGNSSKETPGSSARRLELSIDSTPGDVHEEQE